MSISHLFARIAVSDFDAARTWYEALFGRAPDMLPEEGEAVWRVTPLGSIYIALDPARAGTSALTVAVTDLEEHAAALGSLGLSTTDAGHGSGPRRLTVSDEDGNTITFFQDPGAETT
jgi:catechol 2,3-dioxygenase-like lactoylglutathione lyase family enzyme